MGETYGVFYNQVINMRHFLGIMDHPSRDGHRANLPDVHCKIQETQDKACGARLHTTPEAVLNQFFP